MHGDPSTIELYAFPPGLDSLYARIIEQISYSRDIDLYKQILAITTIIRWLISLRELTTLIRMLDDILDNIESLEEVIKACSSFLTLREQMIYFVYQLAKDFLLGKATY